MRTVRIGDIEPIPILDGELEWRPIRRTLGIEAFGINAYTANAGELVVEEHDETGAGAGHHEELYVVVTGRATFSVDGKSFDAPVGTQGIQRCCTTWRATRCSRAVATKL